MGFGCERLQKAGWSQPILRFASSRPDVGYGLSPERGPPLWDVLGHTATKRAQWQVEHELRKYELALVHGGFGRKSAKNRQSDTRRRSNRDQTQTPNLTSNSLTYDVTM